MVLLLSSMGSQDKTTQPISTVLHNQYVARICTVKKAQNHPSPKADYFIDVLQLFHSLILDQNNTSLICFHILYLAVICIIIIFYLQK